MRSNEATTAEAIGRAIHAVSVEWLQPNFEGMGIRQHSFDELPDPERRLHVDYGKAVLALITAGLPPISLTAEERNSLIRIASDIHRAYQLGTHEQNKLYISAFQQWQKDLVERVLRAAAAITPHQPCNFDDCVFADCAGKISCCPQVKRKEQIARIIDPKAFANWTRYRDLMIGEGKTEPDASMMADYHYKADCDGALTKAEAILTAGRRT
jgi:hypothetical protein